MITRKYPMFVCVCLYACVYMCSCTCISWWVFKGALTRTWQIDWWNQSRSVEARLESPARGSGRTTNHTENAEWCLCGCHLHLPFLVNTAYHWCLIGSRKGTKWYRCLSNAWVIQGVHLLYDISTWQSNHFPEPFPTFNIPCVYDIIHGNV